MASGSTHPQFRYSQPPSKVLHLRNCPWECTEEELVELGKPFGRVINTKCNVGANRNQAFIELADLNQAIAMVSYYASSSEPAQLRGKTVYIQYSNRQEIVNNKTTGDASGNVLLVTIEGVEPRDVSIDVLHLLFFNINLNGTAGPFHGNIFDGSLLHQEKANVFSAFGFVHKIATFEKTAGFQALVQFSDLETASAAKNSLDGRSIPRYLLPEHVNSCSLKITFSAHTDLSVKFQSHRSRDYTNPNLPVAPSAMDGSGQFVVGLDGRKQEQESNVLLASIENMQYPVNVDVLYTVFSAFGPVQKIAMFEKNAGWHALIQYPDVQTATVAKESLEGHCIYDGGFCKLHISSSRHTDLSVKVNNDRSRDYTIPNSSMMSSQPSILGQQPVNAVGPTSASMYSGAPFAAGVDVNVMAAQPVAAWGVNPAAMSQTMGPPMLGTSYMIPGTASPEMAPGMMHLHGHSVPPHVRPMPPYGH